MAPPKRDTKQILLSLHRNTLTAIDQLVQERDGVPSRQEIIREILIDWFKAKGVDADER